MDTEIETPAKKIKLDDNADCGDNPETSKITESDTQLHDIKELKQNYVKCDETNSNAESKLETAECDSASTENKDSNIPAIKEEKDGNCNSSENQSTLLNKLDPLAYTRTGEFTSEIFKIIIDNLPKYASPAEIKKFLRKSLELDPVKIKRPFKTTFAYVTFRNEECRKQAIELINRSTWKNSKSTLHAAVAKPRENPFARNEARGDKKIIDFATVREKTAPLYSMDYQDQLKFKIEEITSVLDNYKVMLKKSWPTGFPEENYMFTINEIKPSSVLYGYRNKCEFTVGKNVDTNDPCTVGFVKGRFSQGNVSVEAPGECVETCSKIMMDEVQKFKEMISQSSFPPYDSVANVGVWKALELRTNREGAIMLTPIVDRRQLSDENLQSIKSLLLDTYKNRSNFSLFVKLIGGKEILNHLSGPEYMTESLCGYEFQITSGSFFQVNTETATVLYETIRDTAHLDQNTVLLDVCCGTGTIGIILSKYVKQVYGIELAKSAVEDAKKNAERNKVENITFHNENAKTATIKILKQIPTFENMRIVAIVDPPRNGLHGDVISCLRGNAMITEIVYVSCDIKQVTDNIVNICRPTSQRYMGNPFRFVSAVSVDMFPHTKKFEVVFHFKRDQY